MNAVTAAAAMERGERVSLSITHLYFISFIHVFNNLDVLLFLIRIHNNFVHRLCGENAERESVTEEELGQRRRRRQLRRLWWNN